VGNLGIMKNLKINLPARFGRGIIVSKNRLAIVKIPTFYFSGKSLLAKRLLKTARIIKHHFEYKKFQKILGLNLAALFLSTSLTQLPFQATDSADNDFVTTAPFVLETKKSLQHPVEKVVITQGYKAFHPGIDLDGLTGDPIRPIMDGTVEAISYSRYAYGNAILINHGDDITSLYAHLSKIFVNANQEVTTDTIIGEMGSTGRASGDHLHLEVRDNGKPFSPLSILPK